MYPVFLAHVVSGMFYSVVANRPQPNLHIYIQIIYTGGDRKEGEGEGRACVRVPYRRKTVFAFCDVLVRDAARTAFLSGARYLCVEPAGKYVATT